jgi:hypothetical protein
MKALAILDGMDEKPRKPLDPATISVCLGCTALVCAYWACTNGSLVELQEGGAYLAAAVEMLLGCIWFAWLGWMRRPRA